MDAAKVPDGSMPPHVINHINEFAVGGFALFYFNARTGSPEWVMYYDDRAHELALQQFMNNWLEGMHDVEVNNAIAAIQGATSEDDATE